MGRNNYVKRRGFVKRKTADANDAVIAEALELPDVINQSTCWRAYHLEETQCCLHVPPNPKVKNCRSNPFCIHRLGLDKIEKLKNQQTDNSNSDLERRDIDKQPCGLVNFGNFCYVNSFLQIWYNDLVFRQCIYDWRPHHGFVPPDGTKMDVQAVMNCMQELFLTMQFTPYETTNALELIRLLRLDNEQHDVQEFNTLFFDALDRNLAHHPNGLNVRRVIQSRFESKIRQTIKCEFCGSKSETESEYRSLQISIEGHNSFMAALRAFFSPESLSDYKCDGCRRSGCVTRFCKFTKLPPILVIQFNRYVFDSNGRHKKLKTPIQYPRTFSEKVLLGELAGNCNYDLSAVMIHEGPNTHCGHYYDLIKNPVDGQWFTYNDKNVVVAKPPGVSVEKESIQRATTHMKECYALIYQRCDANDGITIDNLRLPPTETVIEIQKKLNDRFLKESKEGDTSLNLWKSQVEKRYKFLQDLWDSLEVKNGKEIGRQELAFLPTELLTEILRKEFKAIEEMKSFEEFVPTEIYKGEEYNGTQQENGNSNANGKPKIEKRLSIGSDMYYMEQPQDTRMNLCCHDRVSLDAIFKGEVKAVHRDAAENLLKYYGIGLSAQLQHDYALVIDTLRDLRRSDVGRLKTGMDICVECVKLLKKDANFQKALDKANELPVMRSIRQRTHNPRLMKPSCELPPLGGALWVSERHLRLFKKIALEQMEYSKRSNKLFKYLVFSANPNSKQKSDSIVYTTTVNGSNAKCEFSKSCNGNNNTNGNRVANSSEKSVSPFPPSCSSSSNAKSFGNRKRKLSDDINELKYFKDDDANSRSSNGLSNSPQNSECCEIITESTSDTHEFGMPSTSKGDGEHNENGINSNDVNRLKKPIRFNDELFCEHGNLTYMVRRTWVLEDEWNVLRENFLDYCDPIPCSMAECSLCVQNYVKNVNQQKFCQDVLDGLLAKIGKIMKIIERRRVWNNEELGITYTHVLCTKFIQKFMRCIRVRTIVDIPSICQQCLLCSHEKSYMQLDPVSLPCVPITYDEWQQILDAYDELTSNETPTEIKLMHDGVYAKFCSECSKLHTENENNKRFIYTSGEYIYVKLKEDENEEKEKNSKISSVTTMTTRRLAAKKLMKFKMSSSDRIIDLKLRIYEQIRQSPSDQLFYFNDNVLENEQTLESARIEANNVDNPIILIVQQSVEVCSSGEPRQLEKGFRDTALAI